MTKNETISKNVVDWIEGNDINLSELSDPKALWDAAWAKFEKEYNENN